MRVLMDHNAAFRFDSSTGAAQPTKCHEVDVGYRYVARSRSSADVVDLMYVVGLDLEIYMMKCQHSGIKSSSI